MSVLVSVKVCVCVCACVRACVCVDVSDMGAYNIAFPNALVGIVRMLN